LMRVLVFTVRIKTLIEDEEKAKCDSASAIRFRASAASGEACATCSSEFAPHMGPAGRFLNLSTLVKMMEPGISIGLQESHRT